MTLSFWKHFSRGVSYGLGVSTGIFLFFVIPGVIALAYIGSRMHNS
jgi:hypothetical protein